MIKFEQISKTYKDFTAVSNIQLELTNGIYGLLAPNGAGKTTLIKMLATLISPTSGVITYDGQSIKQLGEIYREKIGYLPQQFGFYKHYSPVQYLRYLGALKGMDTKQIEARIAIVLEQVALTDVQHKKMRKFSGGMIQRVGIAQALLADPSILILDEPTAGLDPKERARFRHLLAELSREKMILISTHVVSDVESIANEIILLKNKEILYKESPAQLCEKIAGKVYEALLDYDTSIAFRKEVIVLEEKQEDGKLRMRFYSEQGEQKSWRKVSPQLEDVFLVIYADVAQVN